MKVSALTSNYLTKEDVDTPRLLTIARITRENVARKNEPPEFKPVLFFSEEERGMVMNKTNLRAVADALGEQDTDQWIGRKVVAFNDPSVEFGGKRVGGIRLRAPKGKGVPEPEPAPAESFDDGDLPF